VGINVLARTFACAPFSRLFRGKSHLRKVLSAAALLVSLLPIATSAQSKQPSLRIEGTIVSTTATSVTLKTTGGTKVVSLAPKVRYFVLSKSSLDKVIQGSFIGTTVVPQPDNTYVSTEVHIFAPSLNGTGEGFTKMDTGGKRMMANATVSTVEHASNMMANSTVRTVGSTGGKKMITMTFPSGTKNITIPAGTPVTFIDKGSQTTLVPGAQVLVIATPGTPAATAKTVIVSKDGASLM
jgi:hypothetical protein